MTSTQFGDYDANLFRQVGFDNEDRILVEVVATSELCIRRNAVLSIEVPSNFPESCISIKTITPELFDSNALLVGGNDIVIPWLSTRKYPIAVWLYAVRNSFKRSDLCPWATPVSLQANFSLKQRDPRLVTFMSGSGRLQGRRPYMEDVDFSFDEIRISEKSRVSIFGVMDGHGGSECSKFGAEEIPSNIIMNMRSGRLKPAEALFQAYVEADRTYLDSSSSRSGSTATVLLWDHLGKVVTVGNAGDTRAVLSRGGCAVDITRDKKATDFEEIARVCEEGGFVVNGRVQGTLAVARALGDRNLKNDNKRFVIADPEITQFRINPEDEFIIIATDGLWDVISSQDAVSMAISELCEEGIFKIGGESLFATGASKVGWTSEGQEVLLKLNSIAEKMAKHAHDIGSCDNITVTILLLLRNPADMPPGPFDVSDGEEDYPAPPPKETGAGGGYYSHNTPTSPIELSLDPRRIHAGLMSPGALSSEILTVMEGPGSSNDSNGRKTTSQMHVQPKTNSSSSYRSNVAEQDDDLMSFLMDDANF